MIVFPWLPVSTAGAAAVYWHQSTFNGLLIFSINGKLTFINEAKSLLTNPSNCIVWQICVFDNFILADELLEKLYENWRLAYSR